MRKEFDSMLEELITNLGFKSIVFVLRTRIKARYQEQGIKPVDVKIRKAKLELAEVGTFDTVVLARRLGWDISDWNGFQLDEIVDPRLRRKKEQGRKEQKQIVMRC
ncbi:hypothetical protein Aduo_016213 [Ancylostoma duodenale]